MAEVEAKQEVPGTEEIEVFTRDTGATPPAKRAQTSELVEEDNDKQTGWELV